MFFGVSFFIPSAAVAVIAASVVRERSAPGEIRLPFAPSRLVLAVHFAIRSKAIKMRKSL